MTVSSATARSGIVAALRRVPIFSFEPIDVSDRANNFYLVRIALAARVIFGHAFVLGGVSVQKGDPTFGAIYNSLGVNGFFVVSGFLVTRSLLSSRSLVDYAAARTLRILPALWVMLALTTLAVLVWGTAPWARESDETWTSALSYLARNMSVALVSYQIHGVFDGMANSAVNGSIWSLRFEVFCYIVLGLFAALGIAKRRILMLAIAVALVAGFLTFGGNEHLSFFSKRFLRLGALFFMGSAMALYPEKLRVNAWFGLALTVAAWAIGSAVGVLDLVYVAFGYLLICVAYSKAPVLRRITRTIEAPGIGKPDLSYGIFLYSFPIQQLLYYNHLTPGPLTNILATIVLATICAYLSSEFVEKPTARLRQRILKPAGG